MKNLVVFATLFAVLLVQHAACEEVEEVKQPDELYILNPGSLFPIIVSDPNSPILSADPSQIHRICNPKLCKVVCKIMGFKVGRCNKQSVCICSR